MIEMSFFVAGCFVSLSWGFYFGFTLGRTVFGWQRVKPTPTRDPSNTP
jgi:hypothetical protein